MIMSTAPLVAASVLDLFTHSPERHDQHTWLIVTVAGDNLPVFTGCVAGHAAIASGLVVWTPLYGINGYTLTLVSDGREMKGDDYGIDGDRWSAAGREALGINERLSLLLFDEAVSLATVKEVLTDLVNAVDHEVIEARLRRTFCPASTYCACESCGEYTR